MRIATPIARILLGLIFFVFGLNGFVNFIPAPPLTGLSGEFIGALLKSHYVYLVSGVQLIAGVLLLTNQFVPFAVAILAPVIANILVYHLTMDPHGFPPAILTTGTRDLLLSNTVRVHRKLRALGIDAALNVFEAQSHAQYQFDDRVPETKEAFGEIAEFFDAHPGK